MTKDRSFSTAIHILCAIDFFEGKLAKSDKLAGSLKTNPGLVRRMLTKLAGGGLIETVKGKNGGSRLAMPASEISLKMVYQAIGAGPLLHSFTKNPLSSCPISCQMGDVLENVYSELEDGVLEDLKAITIADLMKHMQ